MEWMIYGANGYTGELIARQAKEQGLTPVLAGRSAASIEPLAKELGFSSRIFSLDSAADVNKQLSGIRLVLHCAGPFSATSAPMIEGCLAAGAHYLDISGEIEVFEHAHAPEQAERARKAGVVLCPGVGFDVIPTDCVALRLKELLPDATDLCLGFDTRSGLSPGTARTAVEGFGQGGQARINGKISRVPLGWKKRDIDFGQGSKPAMTIPWGDVSTAWHTTGIANISTWIPFPSMMIHGAKLANLIRPLLATSVVQNWLKKRVDKKVQGPDASTRSRRPTWVWGEARNAAGKLVTVRIKTANGYSLTVDGSLAIAQHLLSAQDIEGGSKTPAILMGSSFVEALPGSEPFQIS